jgi:pRiA4b ORF-3-like protein
VADWLTVRVTLLGHDDDDLSGAEPGRIFLVRADHTFADLADAIDTAFARWDLTPPHTFEVAGRHLWSDVTLADRGTRAEPSAAVQVGEVRLRAGTTFRYLFDLGERWEHLCEVERVDVDPLAEYGDAPELPVPVFGWGAIPDQYGREREDEDDELDVYDEQRPPVSVIDQPLSDSRPPTPADPWDDDPAFQAAEDEARADAWQVAAAALAPLNRPLDRDELARAARALRHHVGEERFPYDLLWAAAMLDELPDDDAQLWIILAAAIIEPRGDLPIQPDVEAAWTALEPADWAAAVIELVRRGVGQRCAPEDLVALVAGSPDIEGPPLTPDDIEMLELAFTPVVGLWRVLGALDDRQRLTALGRWGLPEALRYAWTR